MWSCSIRAKLTMRSSASIVGADESREQSESLSVETAGLRSAGQKRPASEAAASKRGGTYQASLEPLASINCERIGILPPVNGLVEPLSDASTSADSLFHQTVRRSRRVAPAAGQSFP